MPHQLKGTTWGDPPYLGEDHVLVEDVVGVLEVASWAALEVAGRCSELGVWESEVLQEDYLLLAGSSIETG